MTHPFLPFLQRPRRRTIAGAILLLSLLFVQSTLRPFGSTHFLTSSSRLEHRQKVLHYPNFTFGRARCKSDVVTGRVKRKVVGRIHRQPERVRFSSTRRDGKELCSRSRGEVTLHFLTGSLGPAKHDVARIRGPTQRVSHDCFRFLGSNQLAGLAASYRQQFQD